MGVECHKLENISWALHFWLIRSHVTIFHIIYKQRYSDHKLYQTRLEDTMQWKQIWDYIQESETAH